MAQRHKAVGIKKRFPTSFTSFPHTNRGEVIFYGEKPRRAGLLERTAELFDLPADALASLPRLELVGDKELRMENHRGILAYGSEEIHVSGGEFVVKILGEGLELRAMTGLELLITGRIHHIQLT